MCNIDGHMNSTDRHKTIIKVATAHIHTYAHTYIGDLSVYYSCKSDSSKVITENSICHNPKGK